MYGPVAAVSSVPRKEHLSARCPTCVHGQLRAMPRTMVRAMGKAHTSGHGLTCAHMDENLSSLAHLTRLPRGRTCRPPPMKRFTSMSTEEQGRTVETLLQRCGRLTTSRYWIRALAAAAALDRMAALDRDTAAILHRLGLAEAAAEAMADAASHSAEATEIRLAVDYYSPRVLADAGRRPVGASQAASPQAPRRRGSRLRPLRHASEGLRRRIRFGVRRTRLL